MNEAKRSELLGAHGSVVWPLGWHLVFPCSDKLDLSAERNPVACFEYKSHAEEYGRRMWPSTVEILTIGGRWGAYWLHPDGWFRLYPPDTKG